MLAKKALAAALSTPAIEGAYVEDVFSTYLYTGNGSSQSINNGIALADGPANGTVLHLRADAASGGTNNTILDSSTNNYTVTRNGDVAQGSFSPFTSGGGSAYFDGTGDYLYTSGPNLVVGTGAFTLEWWIYLPAAPSGWTGTVNIGDGIWMGSGRLTPLLAGNAAYLRTSLGANYTDYYFNNSPIRVGQWNHIAIQRETSGAVLAYCNGYVATSGSLAGSGVNLTIDEITVGNSDQGNLTGYISNVRLTRGSALYGSTYTVPTAPLTGGSLLLNFTNANIVDSAPIPNNIELEGNTQISNSVYKYGTGSIYFDGSGDRLVIPPQPKLDINGDFTIEMWVYPTNISSYHVLFDTSSTGTAGADMTELWINPSGTVAYYARGSVLFTSTTALSTNTWYHVALTKQNSTQRLFINGVLEGTATSSTQPNTSYYWYIGDRKASAGSGQYPLQGYIDDFRITNGTARYTSNFTAPTAILPLDTLVEGQGGLVWIKDRSSGTYWHCLYDTERGATKEIYSNRTDAQATSSTALTAFNSNGFSLGSFVAVNTNGDNNVSWTFRKAEKFFDVQTWTGTGTSGRQVAHNLGSVPGCVIIKSTSTAGEPWLVYHRSLGASQQLRLNTTDEASSASEPFDGVAPTSTYITLPSYNGVNGSGKTYVGYFFAHDAGGFGDDGDQNVISCGTFTTDSGEASTTTLGWEPQWLLIKKTSAAQDWYLADNMRGLNVAGQDDYFLYPNLSSAEGNNNRIGLTSTGFTTSGFGASSTFIYIAIRRGPMKTPELGTDVYKPVTYTGNGSTQTLTTGFPVDMFWNKTRVAGPGSTMDRMRNQNVLRTEDTNSESAIGTYASTTNVWQNNTGLSFGSSGADGLNESAKSVGLQAFRRAPGFFDVVCYTGTGSAGATTSHNLGVAPELIITRIRNYTGEDWIVHYRNGSTIRGGYLNSTAALAASGSAPSTDLTNFTSTSYERNTGNRRVNGTYNYVAYLFASVAGVSKIGTVNVTGSTVNVDCGFTSGARFVMMKRIENTSPWLVWDTARGIVAGNDPYLKINSTQAEDFDGAADFIDPLSSGFTIAAGGVDGYFGSGDYIYLAIA